MTRGKYGLFLTYASAGISSILPFTPRLKRAEELPYTLRIHGLLAPEVEWGAL